MQTRLQEHFSDNSINVKINDKPTVITFRIQRFYNQQRHDPEEEKIRLIQTAAKLLRDDIKDVQKTSLVLGMGSFSLVMICPQYNSPLLCDGYVRYEEAEVNRLVAIFKRNNCGGGGGPCGVQQAACFGEGCLITVNSAGNVSQPKWIGKQST